MVAEAMDVEGITDGRESPVKMSQLWEHKFYKHFKLIRKGGKACEGDLGAAGAERQ